MLTIGERAAMIARASGSRPHQRFYLLYHLLAPISCRESIFVSPARRLPSLARHNKTVGRGSERRSNARNHFSQPVRTTMGFLECLFFRCFMRCFGVVVFHFQTFRTLIFGCHSFRRVIRFACFARSALSLSFPLDRPFWIYLKRSILLPHLHVCMVVIDACRCTI